MKKEVTKEQIRKSKCVYDDVKVPKELDFLVKQAIEQTIKKEIKQKYNIKEKMIYMKQHWKKVTGIAVACGIFTFTGGLNISPTFAKDMEQNPILGGISKVLTFRDYEWSDGEKTIQTNIPQIDTQKDGYTKEVNEAILKIVAEYEAEATQSIAEYKEAFIATGGTEEEFQAKNIKADVDYEVKSETEDIVSFVLTGYQNWNAGQIVQEYYNINLKENAEMTLQDILGDGYIEMVNKSIKQQIAADKSGLYFNESMGGFTGVTDDTNFYINATGNPVIVFQKYEIAAGAAGSPEFEIVVNK